MREMKDSGVEWIGEIPADWELSKIGAVYEERNEKVSDVDFQPLSVTKQGVVPQLETAAKTNDGENRKLIRKNDFVINSRSDRRGSCGISEYDGSCSLINTVLKPRRNMCNAYYSFVFRSERFADEFYRWGNGIVDDLWSTKWSNMKRIYIPAPSLQEQHRIADYLDRKCSQIDAIIARQQEVIEKLKAYKLSVITEVVTKGLNPDVPMKDSGIEWIGEIPEHWKIGKLCFFTVRIGDGLHGTPEFDDKGEYYFINGNNLGATYITIKENTKTVGLSEYNKYFIALDENTLLISLNGTIGSVSQYHGEQIILGKSAGYIILDSRRDLTLDYLRFYLQSKSVKTLFELSFAGTTINNLSLETLRNLPVCIMTSEEQLQISKILDKKCLEIESTIQKKQMLIECLAAYKKSLIYEVVTGKKEV